ncbi:conserved hypothetical protein [Ricinus communis]|uniref:DUF4216 domain-containing protein n=1 Tax=Ricinus communis TaxID=3988 RepID=B9S0U7_RICCO|nr:conserved hypothetical protein [Ricinus communis]
MEKRNSGIQREGSITTNQGRQVFYINDPKLGSNWRVVQLFQHRHIYDVDEIQDEAMDLNDLALVEDEVYQENEINDIVIVDLSEIASLNRVDIDLKDVNSFIISELHEGSKDENIIDVDEFDETDDTLVDYCTSDEDIQK